MNMRSGRSGSMHFTGSSPGARHDESPTDAQTEPSAENFGSNRTSALFFNDNDANSTS